MSKAAVTLTGPYLAPLGLNTVSLHVAPSQHNKGSVNKGGGGGGKGSGCGKPSPCGPSKKKNKSCGGGGGCGGKKKKSCSPNKYKVVFKDFNAKSLPSGNTSADTQEVEKSGTAIAPDVPEIPGYAFDKWDTSDYMDVQKDMEVNAVYRKLVTGEEVNNGEAVDLINKMTQEAGDKIQDFSDEYLNVQNASVARKIMARNANQYVTRVTNYGKYNAAIDKCVECNDIITEVIEELLDQLLEHLDDCTDLDTFHDIKKCILNIKTSFVFQTRMAFNLDLQDIYAKLNVYVEELKEMARNGQDIDAKIEEYRSELDLDLEFFLDDNADRYDEFRKAYNEYIQTLNGCFPEPFIQNFPGT